MIIKIIDETLLEVNNKRLLDAFYDTIKDISKRGSLTILHMQKNGDNWDMDLLECAIPNLFFKGLKIPNSLISGATSDSVYIQLNYKVIQMLGNGSSFIINPQTITIKNESLLIKDAYPYTSEEIEANYLSYKSVTEDLNTPIKMSIDQESSILKYIKAISSKNDAFFYTKENEATVLVDESMVLYSKEMVLDKNFYFNCYLANRVLKLLGIVDRIELLVSESNIQIKGFMEDDMILVNTSPVYEIPMDIIGLDDLRPLLPESEPVDVDANEFIQSILSLKSSANSFISNIDNFKVTKNGEGLTLQFKESFNKALDETEINLNIGKVNENSAINQPDYFIHLPIKYIQDFSNVGSILSLSSDEDNYDTSFLVKLSEDIFIITGKN